VRLAQGLSPTPLQTEAADAYARLDALTKQLYITEQTAHILQRRPPQYAAAILNDTRTLRKGRYLRRWARRLRSFGFSPEDAMVIAYGSFGVDLNSLLVGIEAIVTNDFRLVSNFNEQQAKIKTRFEQMARKLSEPYASLQLPAVLTTATVLALR
jgi:hypothetical protein